jgi:hypothetical protein
MPKIEEARNNALKVVKGFMKLKEEYAIQTNNEWLKDVPPTELVPSVADIQEVHPEDHRLKNRFNKYAHLVINSKQLFEWLIVENPICKALSWCRCQLAKDIEDGNFAHEHWHMLVKYHFGKGYWKNSEALTSILKRQLKHFKLTTNKKLFKAVKTCNCSSPLNGIIHYIGDSTGQNGKHIHLDRHSSWHHDRGTVRIDADTVTSTCMKLMKGEIRSTYNLDVHDTAESGCDCNTKFRARMTKGRRIKRLRTMNGFLPKNKEGPQPNAKVLREEVKKHVNSLVSVEYSAL